jgi:hypothetical protein
LQEVRSRSLALALAVLAAVLACGCGAEPQAEAEPEPEPAPPAQLVLAGDGELWVVDVASETARHIRARELAPGDPQHRVVRRGDRFAFWGYDVYVAADPSAPLTRIADGTWFFIPSADPERIWVTVLDPRTPATRNGLKAIREITLDGDVTVPDIEPPGGDWPAGAITSGLLFDRGGAITVWDPRTGREVRTLAVKGHVGPTHGDLVTSCAEPCEALWLTDARTGDQRELRAPHDTYFQLWAASFSPDGRRLAVPVSLPTERSPDAPSELALVDVRSLGTDVVPGSTVEAYYVFTDWSAAGDQVFITGGERFKRRTILAYRIGDPAARALDVEVGDFYDMAAR